MQRGKWAYKRGNYEKAVKLFEALIRTETTNQAAKDYLVLAQAGVLAEEAVEAVSINDFEKAIHLLDRALGLDPMNQDARKLLNTSIEELTKTIVNEYVPNKMWARIVPISTLILKYEPDKKVIAVTHAKAVFEVEDKTLNYKSIMAINKSYQKVPDDAFLKNQMEVLENKTAKFKALFKRYQQALLEKDFNKWKSVIHTRYMKEVQVDVRNFIEKDDEKIKSIQDFFFELSKDPEKYGNPQGADIVCIEPVSSAQGFVHFDYKDLPKVLKMEIATDGGAIKLHREEDSEIKKYEL
jgi:tetratricopeptide (TPR) repeat protein